MTVSKICALGVAGRQNSPRSAHRDVRSRTGDLAHKATVTELTTRTGQQAIRLEEQTPEHRLAGCMQWLLQRRRRREHRASRALFPNLENRKGTKAFSLWA